MVRILFKRLCSVVETVVRWDAGSLQEAARAFGVPSGANVFILGGCRGRILGWDALSEAISRRVMEIDQPVTVIIAGQVRIEEVPHTIGQPNQLDSLVLAWLPPLHALVDSLQVGRGGGASTPQPTIVSSDVLRAMAVVVRGETARLERVVRVISDMCRDCSQQQCRVLTVLMEEHCDAFLQALNSFDSVEGAVMPCGVLSPHSSFVSADPPDTRSSSKEGDSFLRRMDEGWDAEADVCLGGDDDGDDNLGRSAPGGEGAHPPSFSARPLPFRHDNVADMCFLRLHGNAGGGVFPLTAEVYAGEAHPGEALSTAFVIGYLRYLTRFVENCHDSPQIALGLRFGFDAVLRYICCAFSLPGVVGAPRGWTGASRNGDPPVLLSWLLLREAVSFVVMAQSWFLQVIRLTTSVRVSDANLLAIDAFVYGEPMPSSTVVGHSLSHSAAAWGVLLSSEVYRAVREAEAIAQCASGALSTGMRLPLPPGVSHRAISLSVFSSCAAVRDVVLRLVADHTSVVRYAPILSCEGSTVGIAVGCVRGMNVGACVVEFTKTQSQLFTSPRNPLAQFESELKRCEGQSGMHAAQVRHFVRSIRGLQASSCCVSSDGLVPSAPSLPPPPPKQTDCARLWSSTMQQYYRALVGPLVDCAASQGVVLLGDGGDERHSVCFVIGDVYDYLSPDVAFSPPSDAVAGGRAWVRNDLGQAYLLLSPLAMQGPAGGFNGHFPRYLPFAAFEDPQTLVPLFGRCATWQSDGLRRVLEARACRTRSCLGACPVAVGDGAGVLEIALHISTGADIRPAQRSLGADGVRLVPLCDASIVHSDAAGEMFNSTFTAGFESGQSGSHFAGQSDEWELCDSDNISHLFLSHHAQPRQDLSWGGDAVPRRSVLPVAQRVHSPHRDRYNVGTISGSHSVASSREASLSIVAADQGPAHVGTSMELAPSHPLRGSRGHAPHRGSMNTSSALARPAAMFGETRLSQSFPPNPPLPAPNGAERLPPSLLFGDNRLASLDLFVADFYDPRLLGVGHPHCGVAVPCRGHASEGLVIDGHLLSHCVHVPLVPRGILTRLIDIHGPPRIGLGALDSECSDDDDDSSGDGSCRPPRELFRAFYAYMARSALAGGPTPTLAEALRQGMLSAQRCMPHRPWLWASYGLIHHGGSLTSALAGQTDNRSSKSRSRPIVAVRNSRLATTDAIVGLMETLIQGVLGRRPDSEEGVLDALLEELEGMAERGRLAGKAFSGSGLSAASISAAPAFNDDEFDEPAAKFSGR